MVNKCVSFDNGIGCSHRTPCAIHHFAEQFFFLELPRSTRAIHFKTKVWWFCSVHLSARAHTSTIIVNIVVIFIFVVVVVTDAARHLFGKVLKNEAHNNANIIYSQWYLAIIWYRIQPPEKRLIGLNLNLWCVIYENVSLSRFWNCMSALLPFSPALKHVSTNEKRSQIRFAKIIAQSSLN